MQEIKKTESIHPLFLCADDVNDIFDNKELCLPQVNFISTEKDSWHEHCCINSQNQLIYSNENRVNISSRTGHSNITMFCHLRQATANVKGNEQEVKALAIDEFDNVFVIVRFEESSVGEDSVCVLFIFDSKGNEQRECLLDFLDHNFNSIECVVGNDSDIVIHVSGFLYVCNSNGELKIQSPLEDISSKLGRSISLQCVTAHNEIVMCLNKSVLVYTKEGMLKRKIDTNYKMEAARYNFVTSKIEVLGAKKSILFQTWSSYYIISYSENDEVDCLYLPVGQPGRSINFRSHPAGPSVFILYTPVEASLALPV